MHYAQMSNGGILGKMYTLPNFNSAFAKVLRSRRVEARISQMKLASAIGGSETYVRRMEREKQTPTTTTLILLARALGMEPEKFFSEIMQQLAFLDAQQEKH